MAGHSAYTRTTGFLTGLLLLASVSPVYAEIRTVRGLAVPVDEVSAVDSKNSRISLDGKMFLVPNEAVDTTILQQGLQSLTVIQKLNPASLIDFIRNAQHDNDAELVTLGFSALLSHKKLTLDQARELLSGAADSPPLVEAMKRVVQDAAAWNVIIPSLKAAVLVELGIADSVWIRQFALAPAVALNDEMHRYARIVFSDALKARRFARLPLLASLFRDLFGVEDGLFQEFRLVSDQLTRFHQGLKARDVNALEIGLVSLRSDDALKTTLYPYLVEEIHQAAREEVDEGRAPAAMELLCLIDTNFRTQTTHTLLRMALERLPLENSQLLDRPVIKRFLLAVSPYDEKLKALLVERLETQFRAAAQTGDLNRADRALETLAALRPDPEVANDELRVFYAQELRSQGRIVQSQTQIRNIKTGVPPLVRLSMFSLDTLGISFTLLVTIVCSGMIFITLALLQLTRRFPRRVMVADEEESESDRQEAESESDHRRDQDEFAGPRFRRMDTPKASPEQKEYLHCLSVFSLGPDASLKQIRQAYRAAVKEHHPDRHTEGIATDRFVNLNQTYERIIELRSLLGKLDN